MPSPPNVGNGWKPDIADQRSSGQEVAMIGTCCERMAYDLTHTCNLHADRAACPDVMIAQVRGGFGLYVRDGEDGYATSTIEIAYCPWCGTKLPPIGDLDLSSLPERNVRNGWKADVQRSERS